MMMTMMVMMMIMMINADPHTLKAGQVQVKLLTVEENTQVKKNDNSNITAIIK